MRNLLLVAAFAAATAGVGSARAGDHGHQSKCPHCDHVCELSRETVKEKKKGWEIECKPICIPRITFPWQKCCEPKCARLKYVNVLQKYEYECEKCAYKWTAVCPKCDKGGAKGMAPVPGDVPVPPIPPVSAQRARPVPLRVLPAAHGR